jgi:hypothetical protein
MADPLAASAMPGVADHCTEEEAVRFAADLIKLPAGRKQLSRNVP